MDITFGGATLATSGDDVTVGSSGEFAADVLASTGAPGIATIHTVAQCPALSIGVRRHVKSLGGAIRGMFGAAEAVGAIDMVMCLDNGGADSCILRQAALTGASATASGLAVNLTYTFTGSNIS